MPSLASISEPRARVLPPPQRAPMIALAQQARMNHLLRALPEDVWARLSPYTELVMLPVGACPLDSARSRLEFAFFPVSSIVSLVGVTEDGASLQTAMVGIEGMVGVQLLMGNDDFPVRAVVQCGGYAHRMPVRLLADEFEHTRSVTRLMLRYTQSLITQIGQAAVCNRHHTLEQRLCCWLLSSLDRLPGKDLLVTQEHISNLIGVRREAVTEAIGKLQRLEIVSCSRGCIALLDRDALERLACGCYAIVKSSADIESHHV